MSIGILIAASVLSIGLNTMTPVLAGVILMDSGTSESGGEWELPTPDDVLVGYEGGDSSVPDIDDFMPGDDSDGYAPILDAPIALLAVTGGTYYGSLPTASVEYFRGILAKNPGIPYVAFRSNQYDTYLFYGDGLEYNGSTFTGSGSFVRYNTQNNAGLSYGTDTLSLVPGTGFVWTNIEGGEQYAQFEAEEQLFTLKTILFSILVGFCFVVFCRILFWRRTA